MLRDEFKPAYLIVGGVMLFSAGAFATMSVYELLIFKGVKKR